MSPENLCYWLRGALDCKLAWKECHDKFLVGLKQVLSEVETTRSTDEHLSTFVIWLKAAIELEASVEQIEAKTNSIFEVVINPKKTAQYNPGSLRGEDHYNK